MVSGVAYIALSLGILGSMFDNRYIKENHMFWMLKDAVILSTQNICLVQKIEK